MRLACDTGGTFTDLVVENSDGQLAMFKASTTPADPVAGVLDAIRLAADDAGRPLNEFLGAADTFIHGTTHAINAVITGRTARTAMLVTQGHPDILVLREGGRREPFNFEVRYPEPYVPRALTFEVPGRIDSEGTVRRGLDEAEVRAICAKLREERIEAVAVCLLWSVVNAEHERRVGAILTDELPGVHITLSHELNPTIREYPRASSAAIDASLKPLMTNYLGSLAEKLRGAGFGGQLLVLTSQGGMVAADAIARKPILAINSGPSLAPVAGARFGAATTPGADIIVADTGGTTYDVSLVRGGRIPLTRDAWIGLPFLGHLTGFPSVDVQSVGAGGGSIAHVDEGGMLHVGPASAGAQPGPVCYGRGGTEPTFSDACVALGYIDPDYFLGGAFRLDLASTKSAIGERIAKPLGLSVEDAALAIVALGTENMVQAIADITVNQGIDPRESVLIGGGGAAGLNSIFIARRLGIPRLIIPELGAALSAAGALMSDLAAEFRATAYCTTAAFDRDRANAVLAGLERDARAFLDEVETGDRKGCIEYAVEARYDQQVWEIEVPIAAGGFADQGDVDRLRAAMDAAHERIFAFKDPDAPVEVIGWSARASCRVRDDVGRLAEPSAPARPVRTITLPGVGGVEAAILTLPELADGTARRGPAIVETPFSSIVVDERSTFRRDGDGNLVIDLEDLT